MKALVWNNLNNSVIDHSLCVPSSKGDRILLFQYLFITLFSKKFSLQFLACQSHLIFCHKFYIGVWYILGIDFMLLFVDLIHHHNFDHKLMWIGVSFIGIWLLRFPFFKWWPGTLLVFPFALNKYWTFHAKNFSYAISTRDSNTV